MNLEQYIMFMIVFGIYLSYLSGKFDELETKLLRSNSESKRDLESRLEILERKMFDIEDRQTERFIVKLSDIQTRLRSIEDNLS